MENSRVEIDTRAPFQSVKEAIVLFGERVLAGEIYANKIKEAKSRTNEVGSGSARLASIAAELERTKEKLKESRAESEAMSECLNSIIEELEETKKQLESLKAKGKEEDRRQPEETEITDIKFVEETKKDVAEIEQSRKVRYVSFADPPSLAEVLSTDVESVPRRNAEAGNNMPSEKKKKKKKKKPLIPLIGGIFSRKKGSERAASSMN
ncbi:WEB family protein At3g51220-like [Nymphaea colorata]|nr:WEB family protein At3g51220-like [Nymphaea colorata]